MWIQFSRSGRSLLAVLVGLALAACGDTSSGPGPGPGATAGTVRGVITSSSGLVVNGVSFDTSSATISVDGVSTPAGGALLKGRIATVKGVFDDKNGTASSVSISSACQGQVLDKSGPMLDVGGLVVKVDGQTEFDDSGHSLDSISPGDRVEVHGFPDDSGAVRATRIEKHAGQAEDFEVKGFVSDLQAAAIPPSFTLRLTPAATDAFAVTLAPGVSLPAGIVNGSLVEVKSAGPASPSGALVATEVKLEDAKLGEDNQRLEVEGLVTSGNAASFTVGAQAVVTSGSTEFKNGAAGDVVPGARVEVEGTLDAQGILHADEVKFGDDLRLQAVPANLQASDAFTGSFTLLGVTVHTDALTEFKDFHGNPIDLQHLGGPVAVRGALGRDGTSVVASRLERTDDTRIELRGPVSSKDAAAHRLVILGIHVDTSSAEFEGQGTSTEASFFTALSIGAEVDARGKDAGAFSAGVLKAERVELDGD
jgi:hypothetical protein